MLCRQDSSNGRNVFFAALTIASFLAAGCYDPAFPQVPDGGDEGDSGVPGVTVDLSITPADRHPGDVLTFTLTVFQDGTAVDGLQPALHFRQTEGGTAEGDITLSAEGEPGTYEGTRVFTEGTFAMTSSFELQEETIERSFPPLEVAGH